MIEFDYSHLHTPILQTELSRIQEQMAGLLRRHELIVRVLAGRAIDASITSQQPQADDAVL